MKNTNTIYVKLLDEDIDVWRPVLAVKDNIKNAYLILDIPENTMPQNEVWEFKPGSLVIVKEHEAGGEKILVALEHAHIT
jgi:hypothetical protein